MVKIIKNTTNADILHTASGINFAANSSHTLDTQDALKVIDSQTFDLIASGDFVYNDGSSDITDSATAWSYLTGEQVLQQDSEKAQYFLHKYAPTGWHYQAHPIEFKTSELASIYSKDESGANFGFTSIKFYDSNDAELTDQGQIDLYCVKTVVVWEPTHDYMIISGRLFWSTPVTENVRLYTIGVPDLTWAQGGSRLFIAGVNLKFMSQGMPLVTDGRAPKRMNYSATYHTNKFKYSFKHPAGHKLELLILIDLYKF